MFRSTQTLIALFLVSSAMLLLIAQAGVAKPTSKAPEVAIQTPTTQKPSNENDEDDEAGSRSASGEDDTEDYLDEEEKPKQSHHHHLHIHANPKSEAASRSALSLLNKEPTKPCPCSTTKPTVPSVSSTKKPTDPSSAKKVISEDNNDNDETDSSDDYSDEGEYRTTVAPDCTKVPNVINKHTVVSTTKSPPTQKANITIKPLITKTKPTPPKTTPPSKTEESSEMSGSPPGSHSFGKKHLGAPKV